jgi:tetratricopeptide (TPR) repeat protein
VARHGAWVVGEAPGGSATGAWRAAVARARGGPDTGPHGDRSASLAPEEVWVLDDADEAAADRAVVPPAGGSTTGRAPLRHRIPGAVLEELAVAAGALRGPKLGQRLGEASHAYDRDRYAEALRLTRPLVDAAPTSAAVRELHGLILYRMGRWSQAIRELGAYRELSGSSNQDPVLMDCNRALGRYGEVRRLWDELRRASPSAEVVAEGRIVMAGALADEGDLSPAIRLLERSGAVRTPREHHLRQWYALADLLERAGDIPRARDLFNRLASVDPDAFDTRERLRALR